VTRHARSLNAYGLRSLTLSRLKLSAKSVGDRRWRWHSVELRHRRQPLGRPHHVLTDGERLRLRSASPQRFPEPCRLQSGTGSLSGWDLGILPGSSILMASIHRKGYNHDQRRACREEDDSSNLHWSSTVGWVCNRHHRPGRHPYREHHCSKPDGCPSSHADFEPNPNGCHRYSFHLPIARTVTHRHIGLS